MRINRVREFFSRKVMNLAFKVCSVYEISVLMLWKVHSEIDGNSDPLDNAHCLLDMCHCPEEDEYLEWAFEGDF